MTGTPAQPLRSLVGILGIVLTACVTGTAAAQAPPDAAGTWEGEARTNGARLPLTVTLERGLTGWKGTVDAPSQYALAYPLSNVGADSARVRFELPAVLPPGVFEGALERGRIHGPFTSAMGADTLEGTFELWRRPPATAPYASEAVRFRNGDLELAGTVFRPPGAGPHPAVVFVHGSGPQTRDSYLRWFADRFARAGFVTLIYDKRGTGESGGAPWPETDGGFPDLADDALAGVRLLRERADVNPDRIGIWGLSQGAWIAPLAADRAPELVGFLILLSGGGVSPAEQELYDDEVKLRDLGFDEASIAHALAYLRLADVYVRSGSDEDWLRFEAARQEARAQPWYGALDRFPQILPREAPVWRGLRSDLDYDPTPVLARLTGPVLLLLGEEDRSTPSRETALRVREALEGGGNPPLAIRILPGADHALTVKPSADAPWLAATPADYVDAMVEWALEDATLRENTRSNP